MARFQSSRAAWPQATILKDGGIHITGKYGQPGLYANMWAMYWVICLFFGLPLLVAVAQAIGPPAFFIMGVVAAGFYWLVWKPFVLAFLRKNVDVKIYSGKIQLRRKFGGYDNFSRTEPIEFRIEQHQRAAREIAKKRAETTYREAVEVVMWYGEMRHVIAELPNIDMAHAQALVIRLQNVCNKMDEVMREIAGQLAHASRQSEFGPAPEVR